MFITANDRLHCLNTFSRGGSRGTVQGVHRGVRVWFIGVEVEQETSATPPKKIPGSAPVFLEDSVDQVDPDDFMVTRR